ncbi:MAG: DUF2298 domain-containing protein [Chloroflexota bacterium]|nr:DUF2298 domain-containing protein [Chloroflexota bacterium]
MQIAYVVSWWVALEVIGLVTFPLVARLCGGLNDRGYAITKLVGLVFLTYLVWVLSSLRLLSFGYASILIGFALLAAFSLFVGRHNLKLRDWPWKQIAVSESVFTASFVLFVIIMLGNPDIYYYMGDYYSNFHFLTSIVRGGFFPPVDSWLAGETVSYYYGGHLLVGTLSVLANVPPAIAFNIAGAMFAALAVNACYGLGFNITQRKVYGFLTALLVCVVGYISGAFQLLAFAFHRPLLGYGPLGVSGMAEWWINFDFWTAPDLIRDSWVGYPYFKFVRWDMHSYMMSVPFQVGFLTLLLASFKKGREAAKVVRWDMVWEVLVLGVCLGFFFILNTWEYATYIVLTVAAFVLLRIGPRLRTNVAIPLAIIALSFILYLPHFLSGSVGGFSGLGLVQTRTTLGGFLEFGSLLLFTCGSLLFLLARREVFRGRRAVIVGAAVLAAAVVAAVLLDFYILIIIVPMGLLSLYCLPRLTPNWGLQFVLLLVMIGAALAFFCDFLYVDDSLGGEWERWNTVTKVYMQIWVLLAIPASYAVYYVVKSVGRKARVVWLVVLAVLALACLIHPVGLTASAQSGRHGFLGLTRGSLDGMAYLAEVDVGDYHALRWTNEEITGSPVIVEAPRSDIAWSTRVSTFTGLPTVVGHGICEVTWGRPWDWVWEREQDVATIYTTLDNEEALALLRKYDVKYIYVGTIERETYEEEGLDKFALYPQAYRPVYDSEGVVIYEVTE